LSQKYGEESRLIYNLADESGEALSLRYDLTVPFSRYLAMNRITSMKRYQIGKVYRRDQPSTSKAKYREFYQCDFDIAGISEPMVADSECVKLLVEILEKLEIDSFKIKINHRALLDGIFEVCGVPSEKIRTTSSAIDKLDKIPWAAVKTELINDRQVRVHVVEKIEKYINYKGDLGMIQNLRADGELMANTSVKKGVDELELLYKFCRLFKISDKVEFNLNI
jgi:histidyl-tRNA synthetase